MVNGVKCAVIPGLSWKKQTHLKSLKIKGTFGKLGFENKQYNKLLTTHESKKKQDKTKYF